MTETQLQCQVAGFLRSRLGPGTTFAHVPNGGSRARIEGMIFKNMGVRAGFPDLIILHASRAYLIELKTDKGALSEAQKRMHAELKETGCPIAVCRSLDEVKIMLDAWNVPLRTQSRSMERAEHAVEAAIAARRVA